MANPSIHRKCLLVLTAALALNCAATGLARAAGPPDDVDALAEVLVTGERPGPGMWRISKGAHDLWILATSTPLPKKMVWRARAVEERIATSQVVLTPAQFDADIGFFRGITLVPALLHARHNPDGKSLEQALPHDLYIRWLALRVKYLGHSDESVRPILAAFDLYTHALDEIGLTPDDDEVWAVVKKTAKEHGVPIEQVTLKLPMKNPKDTIRGLDLIPRDAEIACLDKTMARLEVDVPSMRRRANLWSLGDIDGLRAMPVADQGITCLDALLAAPQLQTQFSQIDRSLDDIWLTAADNALAKNNSSFSVLPIAELFSKNGLLAKLRAKGYAVEEPQDTAK